jgi:tetraacyldisaccharide 4'-kinase
MLRLLLYPFAVLYDAVTTVRNVLYDRGQKPAATFDVPVIGVGNLAVGGTGKTPMIEYLIRLLETNSKIATLSRGYGRKTRGFRIISDDDDAETVGDEPFQLHQKFGNKIVVTVGEERALAIPLILQEKENIDVILLDDAFQHRRVKPSFQILLTEFGNPFYKDFVLPAGRLRESSRGTTRADVVVVTKSPRDLSDDLMMQVSDRIQEIAEKPVFFSTIRYGSPIGLAPGQSCGKKVVLLTGIANEKPFVEYVSSHFDLVHHFNFADHHQFTRSEIEKVLSLVKQQNASLLTTEKDASRLMSGSIRNMIKDHPVFYVPIQMEFVKNGEDFDEMVLNAVKPAHAS